MATQAMKNFGYVAVMVCGALLTGVPAVAQSSCAPPPPPAHGHKHEKAAKGPMADVLASLNLTPDQQKVADDAQADGMTKMKALKDDTTLDPKAKRKQMMSIQMDEATKIKAVLTDDQKAKFDTQMAAMREQMKAKHAGGAGAPPADGAAPSTPPPPPSN